MIRDFLLWLQNDLGKGADEFSMSWSEALLGSLNFWGLLEGTHLLSLMLFAGTIFVVDLRILGVVFRGTPISTVSKKVLPLTVAGFAIIIATGLLLFFAKPIFYYHNLWFRLKVAFILVAMINIAIFHLRVERGSAQWDAAALPPVAARVLAGLSLAAWILVITMGRFMAYNWYDCGKPLPAIINVMQSCASSDKGAVDLKGERL